MRIASLAAGLLLALAPLAPARGQTFFAVGGGSASSATFAAEASVGGIVGAAAAATVSGAAGFRASLPSDGPSGVLPAVVATAGQAASVVAFLEDDVQVVSATLHYRTGGAAAFTSVPMTLVDEPTGEWRAEIPAAACDVRGVQYWVEASDGVTVSSLPPSAPTAGLSSLSVQVTNHPTFALPAGGYVLAGVPFAAQNPDPLAVFDELGAYDPVVWRYGTYDPASGAFREPGAAQPAVPGRGFWVISRDGAQIAATGRSTSLAADAAWTLSPGFNLIANPFAFPVDFADVALAPGVDANLIGWNGTAYVNGSPRLEPGAGYFLYLDAAAPVTIAIPPLGAGVARRPAAAGDPGALAGNEADAWGYVVRAEAGGFTDEGNRFGVRPGATGAKDAAFDFADAPAPPGPHAIVSFLPEEGVALLSDWRAPDPAGMSWTLRLRTDRVGVPFRVELSEERPLPDGWVLTALPADGRDAVDLTGGGALTGNVSSTATERTWTLTAGTPDYVDAQQEALRAAADASVTAFAFAAPFPNPARASGKVSFELRVPAPTGDARVSIHDVTGRRVATVLDGPVSRGIHRFDWNAADASGRRVASGVYFVQVRAGDFAHRAKLVLIR